MFIWLKRKNNNKSIFCHLLLVVVASYARSFGFICPGLRFLPLILVKIFAFFLRVTCEDQWHSRVCALDMEQKTRRWLA